MKTPILVVLLACASFALLRCSRVLHGARPAPVPSPVERAEPLVAAAEAAEAERVALEAARTPVSPAEETEAAVEATSAVEGSVRGIVEGIVVDEQLRAVPGVAVELHGDDGALVASREVDGRGRFTLEAPPGEYTVLIAVESLPPGHLPPWEQDRAGTAFMLQSGEHSGYGSTDVVVPEEGGVVTVRLRVFRAATVVGHVLGPHGEPVENASVRIQSVALNAPPSLVADAVTDAAGRYEMLGVMPSTYRTQLFTDTAVDPVHRDLARPLPERVVVQGGGVYEVPPLRLGAGGRLITGSVVDQDGAPFADLQITCYPGFEPEEGDGPYDYSSVMHRVVTDPGGRFVLDGLAPAQYRLKIGDYDPNRLGRHRTAFWIQPPEVDLRDARSVDLPPIQIDESRPFRFEGRIELDETWARERGATPRSMRVEIDLVDPDKPRPLDGPRRPSFRKRRSSVDDEGRFAWIHETPLPPVRITIWSRHLEHRLELVVHPQPNGTESRTIRVPR